MNPTKWKTARNHAELDALFSQYGETLRVRMVGKWDDVRIERRAMYSIDLYAASIRGTVYAAGALIGGTMYCLEARVGGAMTLSGARIGRTISVCYASIGGAIDASGARLGGALAYQNGLIQGGIVMPEVMHGVPGQAIAHCDGYILWLGEDGRYYAGCRGPLTREEALAHWGEHRRDERARVFREAILTSSREAIQVTIAAG